MLNRRPLLLVAALVLAVGFLAGLARLASLRYRTGEVYPPYSTFRADPLGAKAIFSAVGALPSFEARRHILPLKKLQPGRPVTLVYLGVSRFSYWTERELQEFDTLVFGGSRVVLAFYPDERAPSPVREQSERERAKAKKEGGEKEGEEKEERGAAGLISFDDFARRYGFQFGYLASSEDKNYDRQAMIPAAGSDLEPVLSWHSALCFRELAADWTKLYESDGEAVVVERRYGRGSLVLLGDSFPFSNEALRTERHSRLLARVFSGPPLVIFDEEHHGVASEQGIVQLALKYRLHGVIAALALIVGLFIWQNVFPFIPLHAARAGEADAVAGRDAAQGFDHLLHRAVKPGELLATCVDEWRRSFAHHPESAAIEAVLAEEQARPARERDLIAAYRRIAARLAKS